MLINRSKLKSIFVFVFKSPNISYLLFSILNAASAKYKYCGGNSFHHDEIKIMVLTVHMYE